MSRKQLLVAMLYSSIALCPAPAAAERTTATSIAIRGDALQEPDSAKADRLLEQFRGVTLSLARAIEVAEGLHGGSRAAAAAFEFSHSAAYRVVTIRSGETWENLIDAYTGQVIGSEVASPLDAFSVDEQSNIVALGSVAQNLTDAVRVAEKAASGKAFGGGLMKQEGVLNFFVVVVCDGELKEVRLEPPLAGRKGSDRYRLR
jgi:hypothetical protein